ncbi:hypothetical protein AB5J52_48310 (plasmid) [Streptomyces sp. R39]|uniref:LysM domain-containing protein n=1 Tax=Streptomyces sp. R39 TaxID=3238631 RepID=A0AB39R4Q8_9ACTN
MPTPSSPTAAGRTLTQLLTAAASLLVLALTIVGLPLLLAWATPVIWAAAHDDLAHLLDQQDTGGSFLLLLVTAGWASWAQFTFCAIREATAQVRGRSWHAPPGMGASQRAAALLVGSILVLLPTSPALASDAQTAPAISAPHATGQDPGQAQQTAPAVNALATHPVYTVRAMRPAESLWGIAERELGNGERWRDIARLNEGRTMTDGTVFQANGFLQPGWQLQMPDTAAPASDVHIQHKEDSAAAEEQGEHVVTVRSGDSLSKIAATELGDADAWPQLFEASRGKEQPNGLPKITDPDVIYAGQHITVPDDQAGQPPQGRDQKAGTGQQKSTTPPVTRAPGGQSHSGDGSGDSSTPAPSQTAMPASPSSAPSTPSSHPAEEPGQDASSRPAEGSATPHASASPSAVSPSAPTSSGPAAPTPATPTHAVPTTAPAGSPLHLRIVLGAGALLAAAITGALALRRTLQRRRRRPGEKIAITPEPSTAEAQLAAAAERHAAARLDVALRTLAHHVAQQEAGDPVLPPLRAARITTSAVEVLPEDIAHQAVTPFVPGKDGWWRLPADAALLDKESAREVSAPYPGLVTIGSTSAGGLLLLNLAQRRALLLDGSPLHITEVCTSLTLELGMSPWATDVQVVTVGFGEDLPQLLPTARIAHMRETAHAVRDLSERLLEAHQLAETRHHPYLLLCASSLDTDTAWQLADIIDKAGAVPVTLIAPARTAAAHFPETDTLNASAHEPQHLDYVGIDVTLQRLEHAAYMQITTALAMSGQPAHPAEGPWQDVPDEPRIAQPPPASAAAPADAAIPASPAASAPEASGGVFPALLAATADPSGLRLLPAATPSHGPGSGSGPAVSPASTNTVTASSNAVENTPGTDSSKAARGHTTSVGHDEKAHDLAAPEIRVLGPVEVTGVSTTGHGPRMAQLAALLFFRPGRSAVGLCEDMDPVSPWSTSTLNARMQGLRSQLGSDPAGNPYVPRRKSSEDPYRLSPKIRCDWIRFLQLVENALPLGPAGLPDLEEALTMVRGRPFGGRPLPWAEPYQQEMITRIIDTAHTVATYRTPDGPHHHDLSAARRAVATGLEVDDTAELLYRDWLRIERAAGNRQGLHTAITRVQQINRALDCSPEPETEQLIHELLNDTGPVRRESV